MNSWLQPVRGGSKIYTPLPVDEGEKTPVTRFSSLHWIIAALLVTNASSIFATYRYATTHSHRLYSQDLEGVDRVYPGLDRSLSKVRFSDYNGNASSKWTAMPSKEVDEAWEQLGVSDDGFILPEAIGRSVYGLDPRKHLYGPKGWFESPDREGFFLIYQATHDLHCLNELRKALHFNHDYYRQFQNLTMVPPWFRVTHINHCVDALRERLMCTADLGVIPNIWTGPGQNEIQFGMEHKCHDYGALMEWNRKWKAHSKPHFKWADENATLPTPENAIFTDMVATPSVPP